MPPKKKLAAWSRSSSGRPATPAPPVGTALGPHGVNIMEFCKQYNAATEAQRGNIIPVEITIFEDRQFTFITKTPPAPELIKAAAGIEKGSGEPHKNKVGRLTKDQLRADRRDQDARPQRQRRRGGREDHRRHRPVDGHHRRRQATAEPSTYQHDRGRAERGPTYHASPVSDRSPDTAGAAVKRSKAYRDATEQDRRATTCTPRWTPSELAKETSTTKFDATVEVAMRLGVDPRKADQMVRGTVNLPHGTGKTARVLVFATGERAEEARPPAPTSSATTS